VMSEEASYDVYVKEGVDHMGRDKLGEAVAHFVERDNAVALKRRLVARGETVLIERSLVHDLSEEEKERWFSDYSRVPEYDPPLDQQVAQEPSEAPQGAAVTTTAAPRPPTDGTEAQTGFEQLPWWRKMLGG
jgi:hypothetical protein